MDDLISRQLAIDAVHEEFDECLVWDESGEYTADEVERILDRVPSAQSVCKTGRWIARDNPGTGWYRVTCSECGEDVTRVAPTIGFFPDVKILWNYCPECGAKMEGDDNEDSPRN